MKSPLPSLQSVVLSAAGLLLIASLPGCDALSRGFAAPSGAEADVVDSAARPEGWESLEDQSSASRLYYQFVDGAGRVRFVERLEDVPATWRPNVGFVKMDSPPPLSPGDAAHTRALAARASPTAGGATPAVSGGPEIVLYSADWCGACQKAKRYLAKNGVAYEERDVDQPRYADELVRKTGRRSIPVIEADGRIVSGFDPRSYDELVRGA